MIFIYNPYIHIHEWFINSRFIWNIFSSIQPFNFVILDFIRHQCFVMQITHLSIFLSAKYTLKFCPEASIFPKLSYEEYRLPMVHF